MQTRQTLFAICLLLAFSVPAWGESNDGTANETAVQGNEATAPATSFKAGDYQRDPRDAMKMRQYLKNLHQKQKEVAAGIAATKAKNAAPEAAAPEKSEGGTQ